MWGEVVEQKPVIYQIDHNNSKVAIKGEYKIMGTSAFGFKMTGDFDNSLPLVIDPVLSYSTYLGGSGSDLGFSIAVDGSGSAYVTGVTSSTDFPTLNPYQTNNQGVWDVFVTKLSSSGNSLLYSTYLGGSGTDWGNSIALDGSGSAYVTGYTSSTDFPTLNEFQTDQAQWDAFVTKFTNPPNCCVLPGDFSGNATLNIQDLTQHVAWMFKGGAAPACLNNADVNGNCETNIQDVTIRVAFMFKGGPDLICGCAE